VPLAVDGYIGPKTTDAIRRFQQARCRVVDGRVDVGAQTVTILGNMLNSQGRMPQGLPNVGMPDPQIVQGLTGGGPIAGPSLVNTTSPGVMPLPGFSSAMPVGTSAVGGTPVGASSSILGANDWSIKSSGGLDISVSVVGVTTINIYMERDSQPGVPYRFLFGGIGAGLSALPIGLDVSFADMPSWGTRLRQGPLGSNPMPIDDFKNPCTIYSIGANVGPGWSGTLLMFGCYGPLVLSTRAFGAMTGMQVGLPGGSISAYWGYIADWL
jgi:peptidoglycan hydrolase-like protein with peptidoglycan-binding domain